MDTNAYFVSEALSCNPFDTAMLIRHVICCEFDSKSGFLVDPSLREYYELRCQIRNKLLNMLYKYRSMGYMVHTITRLIWKVKTVTFMHYVYQNLKEIIHAENNREI